MKRAFYKAYLMPTPLLLVVLHLLLHHVCGRQEFENVKSFYSKAISDTNTLPYRVGGSLHNHLHNIPDEHHGALSVTSNDVRRALRLGIRQNSPPAVPEGCSTTKMAGNEDDDVVQEDIPNTLVLHCSHSGLVAFPTPLPFPTISL